MLIAMKLKPVVLIATKLKTVVLIARTQKLDCYVSLSYYIYIFSFQSKFFNPLVPDTPIDKPFSLQIQVFKVKLRIFMFCTLCTNGLFIYIKVSKLSLKTDLLKSKKSIKHLIDRY